MAKKTFLQIKETEAKAHDLIKSAQVEAEQIIKQAEAEAKSAFLRHSEEIEQQVMLKKRRAEADAQECSAAFSKETEKECAELKKEWLSRKEKAVAAVAAVITAHIRTEK